MIGGGVGLAVTFGALALFAAVGVLGARRLGFGTRDRYLTARGSQGTGALSLSFFASALGTWILFAPPEVGTFAGLLGILGYAAGQAAAIGIFAALGPAVRRRMPGGSTVLEFVRERFGRTAQGAVGGVSVFYMFIFLTAELTAIGGVLALLGGVDPLITVVAVAAATAAYTAYGGLPASLATDRWQGWLILGLVAFAAVAIGVEVSDPVEGLRAGGAGAVSRLGAETFGVLVIAIVAANLFHQGFWQRVWSARDDRTLVRGALGGAWLILPVVFAMGMAGALAVGAGTVEEPSLAFFSLLQGLPAVAVAVVVALGVSLVASTTDTLQNALTSLVAVDVAAGRVSFGAARLVTILLTIPAAVIAVEGLSVLRLFLIADLLAAMIAFPVFLGLWRRATTPAMLAGSAAGLVAVIGVGWVEAGTLYEGLRLLTLPQDLISLRLGAFVAAPIASGVVTAVLSLIRSRGGEPEEGPPPSGSRAARSKRS